MVSLLYSHCVVAIELQTQLGLKKILRHISHKGGTYLSFFFFFWDYAHIFKVFILTGRCVRKISVYLVTGTQKQLVPIDNHCDACSQFIDFLSIMFFFFKVITFLEYRLRRVGWRCFISVAGFIYTRYEVPLWYYQKRNPPKLSLCGLFGLFE